jgi:hypothetical protein
MKRVGCYLNYDVEILDFSSISKKKRYMFGENGEDANIFFYTNDDFSIVS